MKRFTTSIHLVIITCILLAFLVCTKKQNNLTRISNLEFLASNKITAKFYHSNFPHARGNYNGISTASDGKIYYVLCCDSLNFGGQMYVFDPETETIEHLADLSEACGEKGMKAIPQGKCHVNFYEYEGKLFFGTHMSHYKREGARELIGDVPPGYKPYQGGHILSFDLATREYTELCKAPIGEGIIALNMDTQRGRVYCITWPSGHFFRYDVEKDKKKEFGTFFDDGEKGQGYRFQKVSRSLAVCADNGAVFFNNAEGNIFEYDYDKDEVNMVQHENLIKDYFGCLKPNSPETMGYQWRQSRWSKLDNKIYAVHIESEYLFTLDPVTRKIEFVERIASLATKKAGVTGYGVSLGLVFSHNNRILYHISHAHPTDEQLRDLITEEQAELKLKNNHLIAYDIVDHKYADLGKIVFEEGDEPIHINSLALSEDNVFYAMCYRKTGDGKKITDLLSFKLPEFKF